MDHLLNEADARSIVSMLGLALSGDSPFIDKKARVLTRLTAMILGDAWMAVYRDSEAGITTQIQTGSGNEEQGLAIDSSFLAKLEPKIAKGSLVCLEPLSAAGVGSCIVSHRQIAGTDSGLILIYRSQGNPEFDDREKKIAQIILEEIDWLHGTVWPGKSDSPPLPQRLQQILDLLLEGCQRKTIADRLGLSLHTVNDYVKTLYRHFGVHSQAELVNRFVSGDK